MKIKTDGNININININLFRIICTVFVVVLQLIMLSGIVAWAERALAQDAAKTPNKQYKLPPNIKKYFTDKYPKVDEVISSLKYESPNGPDGSLHISGEMKPKNVEAAEGAHEQTRALARAFLLEETELLGIKDIQEFREVSIQADKDNNAYTNIYFQRYVGDLKLQFATINLSVRDDGIIAYIGASLKPSPPDLYEAVKKKNLSEKNVEKIVKHDFKSAALDSKAKIIKKEKMAVSYPPYVIWEVKSNVWLYTIDAFTGEVLKKDDVWRTSRPSN